MTIIWTHFQEQLWDATVYEKYYCMIMQTAAADFLTVIAMPKTGDDRVFYSSTPTFDLAEKFAIATVAELRKETK